MRIITTEDYMAEPLLAQLLGPSFLAQDDSCSCIYCIFRKKLYIILVEIKMKIDLSTRKKFMKKKYYRLPLKDQ